MDTPGTYIKDVAIEISENYQFDNSPHEASAGDFNDKTKKPFIGRINEVRRFQEMLHARRGVFLVTGYRGMGKTSFVNKVLDSLPERDPLTGRGRETISEKSVHSLRARLLKNCQSQRNSMRKRKKRIAVVFFGIKYEFFLLLFKLLDFFSKRPSANVYNRKVIRDSPIRITITQRPPTEGEILRLMVSAVLDQCKKNLNISSRTLYRRRRINFLKGFGILLLLIVVGYVYNSSSVTNLFNMIVNGSTEDGRKHSFARFGLIGSGIIFAAIGLWHVLCPLPSIYLQIEQLFKRCYSSSTIEKDDRVELTVQSLGSKWSNSGQRKIENYPIASSKEIEYELTNFIHQARVSKRHPQQFIFVFDELDKVENGSSEDSSLAEQRKHGNGSPQLRERKQVVLNIIAGLKNFLTVAKAPFIFIAGREMFDASMADIADRQSAVSSIFTYVFYLESFLKEKDKNNSSLSYSIEKYLYFLIHGYEKPKHRSLYDIVDAERLVKQSQQILDDLKKNEDQFFNVWKRLHPVANLFYSRRVKKIIRLKFQTIEDRLLNRISRLTTYHDNTVKINLLLQSFSVYLTYRSNGSPKKLIRIIHEFIRFEEPKEYGISPKYIVWKNSTSVQSPCRYLYFNYKNQQRIGFINYIYRPFLVHYGTSFKLYSDNLIVSTSYLFDHLFKFHPFAFSSTHLEFVPEVFATSSTPALRDHIGKIIDYLRQNHLKETEIGLFDFKFYSKTINEIYYLSKIFEEESAAFNFTLGESEIIKTHLRQKINEQINLNVRHDERPAISSPVPFSIAYLNGALGDLYFFDQQYDDAIIAYSDALKSFPQVIDGSTSVRDFVTMIRFKLKAGITFEKIKSYEESLAFYTEAISDSKRFLTAMLPNRFKFNSDDNLLSAETNKIDSSLSDLLQIINQPFLAQMVLQEKMGIEGITGKKSAINVWGFLQVSDHVQKICGPNTTIMSNFFLQIGNLLFFKNSVYGTEWGSDAKYVNPIPKPYISDINDIHAIQLSLYDAIKPSHYRIPLLALNMYFLGIKYLLKGKIITPTEFDFVFLPGKSISQLAQVINPANFAKHSPSLSKIHYKYLGIYMSHIGDNLLSMLHRSSSDKREGYQLAEIISGEKLTDLHAILSFAKRLDTFQVERQSVSSTSFNEEYQAFLTSRSYTSKLDFSGEGPTISSLQKEFTECFLSDKKRFEYLNSLALNDDEISVHRIVCFYYYSAYYFKKCGRPRSFSFQLRKILYLIRLVVDNDQAITTSQGQEGDVEAMALAIDRFLEILEILVVKPILDVSSETSNYADLHDVKKFRHHLKSSDAKDGAALLNSVSNSPDSREPVILFAHLKLKLLQKEGVRPLTPLVNSQCMLSTQYLRLLELTYSAKLMETRLRHYDYASNSKTSDITEYLHSLMTIISTMDIYDNDYLIGNSFLAYHHLRLGRFFTFSGKGNLFVNYLGITEQEAVDGKNAALSLSDNRILHLIFDSHYHYKMAADYYDKSIKLHSAGHEYKKAMSEILYLEDDLNDASYHFGAAMDRYLLVNGILHKYLRMCQEMNSSLQATINDFFFVSDDAVEESRSDRRTDET